MADAEVEAGKKADVAPASCDSTDKGQPPSNNSLFSNLKKKKKESSGNAEFARSATQLCCTAVCGLVVGVIILGLGTAINISMLVIGAIHFNDCPAEKNIPIFLVVGGAVGLIYSICNLFCIVKNRNKQEQQEDVSNPCVACRLIISTFFIAWFIVGNVWVLRAKSNWSPIVGAANYCDSTLYWFAFWLITANYIFVGVVFVVFLVAICCACCLL